MFQLCLKLDFTARCSYDWGKIGSGKQAADRPIADLAFISPCLGHAISRTFWPGFSSLLECTS